MPAYRRWLLSLSLAAAAQVHAVSTPPVQIHNFMFEPMEVTIRVGDTLTWMNLDDEVHTVVSDSGLFRSGALDTNMTFTYRFDRPGTYHVFCSLHPQMRAIVEVTP